MKFKLLAIALLLSFFPLSAIAKQPKPKHGTFGFQDISFGSRANEVHDKLKSKYRDDFDSINDMATMAISNFPIGSHVGQVILRFTHNSKIFWAYGIFLERHASYAKAWEDAKYLTEVFEIKYGKPAKCYEMPSQKVIDHVLANNLPPNFSYCVWTPAEYIVIRTQIMKEERGWCVMGDVADHRYIENSKEEAAKQF